LVTDHKASLLIRIVETNAIVSPHEKTEDQCAGALNEVELRGPVTFSSPLIQSNSGNDIGFVTHGSAPIDRALIKTISVFSRIFLVSSAATTLPISSSIQVTIAA
jgi:hypothetical protein